MLVLLWRSQNTTFCSFCTDWIGHLLVMMSLCVSPAVFSLLSSSHLFSLTLSSPHFRSSVSFPFSASAVSREGETKCIWWWNRRFERFMRCLLQALDNLVSFMWSLCFPTCKQMHHCWIILDVFSNSIEAQSGLSEKFNQEVRKRGRVILSRRLQVQIPQDHHSGCSHGYLELRSTVWKLSNLSD